MIHINTSGHRGRYNNSKVGKFIPINPQKYFGEQPIYYKSGLEQKMMRYLDRSQSIVRWTYEGLQIKYMDTSSSPRKVRTYHIDFVAYTKGPNNTTRQIWIEVKSKREVSEPKKDSVIEHNTWLKNQCKWKSARLLAESKGCQFKIITEEELN